MSHIISKGEREQKFLKIKENKSYILTPWEANGFHGVLLLVVQFVWWDIFYQVVQITFQGIT
jgi:hypothetical protein